MQPAAPQPYPRCAAAGSAPVGWTWRGVRAASLLLAAAPASTASANAGLRARRRNGCIRGKVGVCVACGVPRHSRGTRRGRQAPLTLFLARAFWFVVFFSRTSSQHGCCRWGSLERGDRVCIGARRRIRRRPRGGRRRAPAERLGRPAGRRAARRCRDARGCRQQRSLARVGASTLARLCRGGHRGRVEHRCGARRARGQHGQRTGAHAGTKCARRVALSCSAAARGG